MLCLCGMLPVEKQRKFHDILSIIGFVAAVIIGAWLINSLVFRSFSVTGPSMEPTMYTGDRLIVTRLPATWQAIRGKAYTPKRGHVVVFRNPRFDELRNDEYVVKRVIGLPGDRILISDGEITVSNADNPEGFDPYEGVHIENVPVSGTLDKVVPADSFFAIGDNRTGEDSLDSRSGLGVIPMENIVGPVSARIYPFDKVSTDF